MFPTKKSADRMYSVSTARSAPEGKYSNSHKESNWKPDHGRCRWYCCLILPENGRGSWTEGNFSRKEEAKSCLLELSLPTLPGKVEEREAADVKANSIIPICGNGTMQPRHREGSQPMTAKGTVKEGKFHENGACALLHHQMWQYPGNSDPGRRNFRWKGETHTGWGKPFS